MGLMKLVVWLWRMDGFCFRALMELMLCRTDDLLKQIKHLGIPSHQLSAELQTLLGGGGQLRSHTVLYCCIPTVYDSHYKMWATIKNEMSFLPTIVQ